MTREELIKLEKSEDWKVRQAVAGNLEKVCAYCADSNLEIDYKQAENLRKYVSEKGKILPRRVTGLCANHQRELTIAIKRARHIALLPLTVE